MLSMIILEYDEDFVSWRTWEGISSLGALPEGWDWNKSGEDVLDGGKLVLVMILDDIPNDDKKGDFRLAGEDLLEILKGFANFRERGVVLM